MLKSVTKSDSERIKLGKIFWRLITMAKEILKDEILKDAQLEQVAGGSWMESVSDVNEAFKRKLPGFANLDGK